ncbi:hypothetical protein [Robinsoniella sp. RHS]|uniref:hypothetical protein n=1 Tax=Robinsoniella TaxID=588605 RepID=UPI0037527476
MQMAGMNFQTRSSTEKIALSLKQCGATFVCPYRAIHTLHQFYFTWCNSPDII